MTTHVLPSSLLERRVRVDLAGCGGNGSQVLSGLARLDRALRSCGHPGGLHVTAWDPDTVTEPNVGRQLFAPADIGHPKATVLVHRLNVFYGLDWSAIPRRYEPPHIASRCDLLITCVDSAAARRELALRPPHAQPLYWLDLGNRQADGQVVLGEPRGANMRPHLPTVVEVFPELLDASLPEDDRPSCSLAEALESQDLFVNQHLATWGSQLLWTLFRRGKISHHGYFINLAGGEVRPIPVPAPPAPAAKKSRGRRAV